MTLADGQFSYRGLTFGDPDTGCAVWINRAEGFEGFDARTSDSDLPRGDGSIRGLDYVGARTVAFELSLAEVEDGDGSTYEALWASVRAAFRPSRAADSELSFKRPGQPERAIRCRPVQLTRGEDFRSYGRVGKAPVVLRAADPRIYSTAVRSGTTPVYTGAATGAADTPLDFALDFAAGSHTEFVAQNDGDSDAYPLVRFYGPASGTMDGVQLLNSATGQMLDIQSSISPGSILEADMDAAATGANRLIVSLDGVTKYGDWELPRQAFALAPGSNPLRFTAGGTSVGAVCSLQWRDTWLQ